MNSTTAVWLSSWFWLWVAPVVLAYWFGWRELVTRYDDGNQRRMGTAGGRYSDQEPDALPVVALPS